MTEQSLTAQELSALIERALKLIEDLQAIVEEITRRQEYTAHHWASLHRAGAGTGGPCGVRESR